MKLLYTLFLISSATASLLATNVYVSMGSFSSPYYEFYSDSAGTVPLTSLDVNETYTFYRLGNAPTHPFYVSDVGYKQTSTTKINLSGDGSETNGITGTQNFTLSFNEFDTANDVLYFFCTAHSSMLDQFSFAASLPLVGTSDLFEDTTNATWIRVLPTTIKAEDLEDSQLQQTVVINITSMPEGSRYRIAKTTANNNWYFANGQPLVLGENIITVPAVSFNRTVKLQFDQGAVEFDSLSVNGISLYGEGGYTFSAPSGSVLASSVFDSGASAYPYAFTSALSEDGISSQSEQTFTINVTALPDEGANYSVYKTTANGNDFTADPVALNLGENIFSVAAVNFDRTVKIRLSADIAIDQFIVNGAYIVGTNENAFTAPSGSVLASSLFDTGDSDYPHIYTSALASDGSSSQAEQSFILNVTALPEGGANYSVYKTTANGFDDNSTPVALVLGANTISRPEVTFDRTVKLRLSADVAIDEFIVNDTYILGTAPLTAPEGSVLASSIFSTGTGSNPYVYTIAENGVNSQDAQIMVLNVTALPEGGASYSVYKTVSNGNGDVGATYELNIGENTIAAAEVDFSRTVKFRLTADIAVDSLSVNGNYLVGSAPAGPPTGSVYPSENFDLGSNPSWPYIYTAALAADGESSQTAFQFLINITALPEAGASYTINKTTANGSWYTSDPKDLVIGVNRFTVPSVEFNRTVKLRLSSSSIAYEYFGVNQVNVFGTPLDSDSDGVDDWTDFAPNDSAVQLEPPTVAPALNISTDGATINIQWTDSSGFQIQSSDDLNSWTPTGDSESPYTDSVGSSKFYKLSND